MGAEAFRQAFQRGDIDAVVADLAPGFAFHHPFDHPPETDTARVGGALAAARATLGDDFRFVAHAQAGQVHMLRWTTTIEDVDMEGVDVVTEDASGRLQELRVNVRPLPAVQTFLAAMQTKGFGG